VTYLPSGMIFALWKGRHLEHSWPRSKGCVYSQDKEAFLWVKLNETNCGLTGTQTLSSLPHEFK
jgi:hypothetical protein